MDKRIISEIDELIKSQSGIETIDQVYENCKQIVMTEFLCCPESYIDYISKKLNY